MLYAKILLVKAAHVHGFIKYIDKKYIRVSNDPMCRVIRASSLWEALMYNVNCIQIPIYFNKLNDFSENLHATLVQTIYINEDNDLRIENASLKYTRVQE